MSDEVPYGIRVRIALVMIVKDEAAGIEQTLRSFGSFVERLFVLDTGSTDRTREIAAECGAIVVSEPFVDFATTRNRALELATIATECDWLLMASGDDIAVSDPSTVIGAVGEAGSDPSIDAFMIERREAGCTYHQAMLVRARAGWRYCGKTHEILIGPQGEISSVKLPGLIVSKREGSWDPTVKARRWRLDLEILKGNLIQHPDDQRSQFYLAQTYECLGDLHLALAAYGQRVDMGGWIEEVYEAQFRVARVLVLLNMPLVVVAVAAQRAYDLYPGGRAEPLRLIERYAAQVAARVPFPKSAMLFVDRLAYTRT